MLEYLHSQCFGLFMKSQTFNHLQTHYQMLKRSISHLPLQIRSLDGDGAWSQRLASFLIHRRWHYILLHSFQWSRVVSSIESLVTNTHTHTLNCHAWLLHWENCSSKARVWWRSSAVAEPDPIGMLPPWCILKCLAQPNQAESSSLPCFSQSVTPLLPYNPPLPPHTHTHTHHHHHTSIHKLGHADQAHITTSRNNTTLRWLGCVTAPKEIGWDPMRSLALWEGRAP